MPGGDINSGRAEPTFGIGQPVRRKEDLRLLTGMGRFSDDVNLRGQAYAYFVRSPHAHAEISSVDARGAAVVPGVIAILTAAEAAADALRPLPAEPRSGKPDPGSPAQPEPVLVNRDGSEIFDSPYPLLAEDRVRFVGQAVAMVVADSLAAAKDGAEKVVVDYTPLPAVTDTRKAASPEAPRLWPGTPSNVCLDAELGDAAATEAAFAKAAHVVRLETWVPRVTAVPMEPRAVLGSFDATSGRYSLWATSGAVVRHKRDIAGVLGVPFDSVRVIAQDVGGNFGSRNSPYPEFALLLWAARRTARPVKWTADRSEAFLTDYQGRDLEVNAELALDREGNFVALRSSHLSNVGAFAVSLVPLRKGLSILSSVYRIPVAHLRGCAVHSNTAPTTPYRSAGRPEAIFVMERLIDLAARQHGFDRVDLRRRNLIAPAAMPYRNPVGLTYDSGEYESVLDAALELGHWTTFAKRKAEARSRGMLRGIGIANYVEITLGAPRERAEITVLPEGIVEIVIGTQSTGQGHETSFAQCVRQWLGVPFEAIRLVQGDTERVAVGGGSHSGRSMRFAGILMGRTSGEIIARGRRIAAHILETAPDSIDFLAGLYTVRGTNRAASLFEVAAAACGRQDLPAGLRGALAAAAEEHFTTPGFPYGCHVCEVEVDPETGFVEIVSYAAVDDVGRAINPLILHGQTHGGIAQGVGQALWEHCRYDPEGGQLLSGSFMDYAMPRAHMLPPFDTRLSEIPSPTNPLGVRAGGEGGTTPGPAVVMNAIVDALAEFGITHLEMPATPERVWRVIRKGRS